MTTMLSRKMQQKPLKDEMNLRTEFVRKTDEHERHDHDEEKKVNVKYNIDKDKNEIEKFGIKNFVT